MQMSGPAKWKLSLSNLAAARKTFPWHIAPVWRKLAKAIHANKEDSYKYTGRGNLVAVVSNGTAVLGLGNIGPDAGKPVMEGKGRAFQSVCRCGRV